MLVQAPLPLPAEGTVLSLSSAQVGGCSEGGCSSAQGLEGLSVGLAADGGRSIVPLS